MKLNKYILGLLIAPAFALAGCSDYEDTEIASPQADENAIGANFSAASTPVVMHPDKTSFTLTLNRVNTKGWFPFRSPLLHVTKYPPGLNSVTNQLHFHLLMVKRQPK